MSNTFSHKITICEKNVNSVEFQKMEPVLLASGGALCYNVLDKGGSVCGFELS